LIDIKNLQFTLPHGMTLIDNVSFNVNPHDFIVLLGSNGSGKSTLIKLLNRAYPISGGEILFDDRSVKSISHQAFSKKVITLTQFVKDSLFFDLTIAENGKLIEESYHSHSLASRQNLKTYLKGFNPKLAKALHTPINNLSGGEQQILAFALYLCHQPDLLLLDEHTSALDPKIADMVMAFTAKVIREKKLTCIMTTHNLEFALAYGNRVLALNHGKLVFECDKSQQTIDKNLLLEKCYI
jgi:putative tryptophan/tyrosine transport system ATP-binding protein